MGLTLGRAKIFEHVAGIVVTPSMHDVLAAEAEVSKAHAQARSLERLALQIIGLRLMGYAGIHLSGIHDTEQLDAPSAASNTGRHACTRWSNGPRPGERAGRCPACRMSPSIRPAPTGDWANPGQRLAQGDRALLPAARPAFTAVQPPQPTEPGLRLGRATPAVEHPTGARVLHRRNAVRKGLWSGATPAVPAAWKTPSTSARKPAPKAWPTALRRHHAQPLRVRRPRVHPQREVPHRQGRPANRCAHRTPDPLHRRRQPPPQLLAHLVPSPAATTTIAKPCGSGLAPQSTTEATLKAPALHASEVPELDN